MNKSYTKQKEDVRLSKEGVLISENTLQQLKEYYKTLPTHYQDMIMAYLLGLKHGNEQH